MAKFLKAELKGRAKLERELDALDPEITKELAVAELDAGEMLVERIQLRAPFKTGQYMQSIEAKRLSAVSAQQRSKNVIAAQTKDKNAVAIVADFYWRFLEFGTRKAPAQPHIFPTYRASRKEIRRIIATVVNRGVKRAANKA